MLRYIKFSEAMPMQQSEYLGAQKRSVAEERESLTEKRKMRTDQYEPQAAMQLLAEHRVNPRAQLIE
jgi:hypothetical protein